jgi:signal transduction histidine kinase/CheY-like chemotaxis protein
VGPDGQLPSSALILTLRDSGEAQPVGVLILGVSPLLPLDASYRDFLVLVATQTEAALAEAQSRQRERHRLQRLAELDQAKTEFYANISHEFRTPLTLLLSPLDELARRRAEIPADLAAELDVAARNARRLLNLVDSLLDFSRLEAGRLRVRPRPTDLTALTADVASVFRGAAHRAGLRLHVDCPPLPAPVWVDPDMWEKVLSNLLSNALKHTFSGEIAVELRHRFYHAELVVRDTGVGIPEDQLPHIFERFHRIKDARARSHEGSGIGLSLVQELVRQHYGRIRVRSKPGDGTTFTIWIPVSPPDRPARPGEAASEPDRDVARAPTASALATVAGSWDAGEAEAVRADILDVPAGATPRPRAASARVIVADDNADMRAYLARLLGDHWQVSTAKDGEEALGLVRRLRPDLVLADVMMPRLDGLALLHAIRADEDLRDTPVILVTAQAGQDAAVAGLLAGADDYIAKPFSARELVARADGQIALARARREGQDRFRALISASWDVVYRMSPDWTQMRALDGRGFIADTSRPSTSWLDEYIHPDDQARVLDAIQAAIRDKSVFALEHRVLRPDGTLAWTLSRAVPLLDDRGEIIEWVGAAAEVRGRTIADLAGLPEES